MTSVQTDTFTPRRRTFVTGIPLHPKDTSKINNRLQSRFKPISFHINAITFTGGLFYLVYFYIETLSLINFFHANYSDN